MNRAAKAAAAMFLYAGIMVGGGVIAFSLAPEGANARTALIVPVACAGAMVLSAILALQIHRVRALGTIGLYMGLVLPLLFAAVIGFRAIKTNGAIDAYRTAQVAYDTGLADGTIEAGPEARASFFAAEDAPDHDKSYLRNTLLLLAIASVGAFGLILAKRPTSADLDVSLSGGRAAAHATRKQSTITASAMSTARSPRSVLPTVCMADLTHIVSQQPCRIIREPVPGRDGQRPESPAGDDHEIGRCLRLERTALHVATPLDLEPGALEARSQRCTCPCAELDAARLHEAQRLVLVVGVQLEGRREEEDASVAAVLEDAQEDDLLAVVPRPHVHGQTALTRREDPLVVDDLDEQRSAGHQCAVGALEHAIQLRVLADVRQGVAQADREPERGLVGEGGGQIQQVSEQEDSVPRGFVMTGRLDHRLRTVDPHGASPFSGEERRVLSRAASEVEHGALRSRRQKAREERSLSLDPPLPGDDAAVVHAGVRIVGAVRRLCHRLAW
jgi:hypothetical protein